MSKHFFNDYIIQGMLNIWEYICKFTMAVSNLVEKMKWHTVLIALTTNHNSDIASFLKVVMRNDRWLCDPDRGMHSNMRCLIILRVCKQWVMSYCLNSCYKVLWSIPSPTVVKLWIEGVVVHVLAGHCSSFPHDLYDPGVAGKEFS